MLLFTSYVEMFVIFKFSAKYVSRSDCYMYCIFTANVTFVDYSS